MGKSLSPRRDRQLAPTSAAVSRLAGVTTRLYQPVQMPEENTRERILASVVGTLPPSAMADVASLRAPDDYEEFLDGAVHRWVGLTDSIFEEQWPHLAGDEAGTLILAALRGLHLDLLAKSDRARVETALETSLRLFEQPAPTEGKRGR